MPERAERVAPEDDSGYNGAAMEHVGRIFSSHREASEADRQFYRSLNPEERFRIAEELRRRIYPDLDTLPGVRESRVVAIIRK